MKICCDKCENEATQKFSLPCGVAKKLRGRIVAPFRGYMELCEGCQNKVNEAVLDALRRFLEAGT